MLFNKYKIKTLYMIMTVLVFVIASDAILSNNGITMFKNLDSLIGYNVSQFIYIIAGISLILLSIKKHTWLPFLGDAVIPSILIPETKNVGDTTIKIKVTPNTKVAYWSSLPSNKENIPVDKAYGDYSNAGVSKSDKDGYASLTFNKGSGYVVPGGRFLKPHVHYRELHNEYGMIGPVNTVYLN
jgi:hypothetical protein